VLDLCSYVLCVQGGPKKWGHGQSGPIKKFTGRFFGKCVVIWILKIPPHPGYVAFLYASPSLQEPSLGILTVIMVPDFVNSLSTSRS